MIPKKVETVLVHLASNKDRRLRINKADFEAEKDAAKLAKRKCKFVLETKQDEPKSRDQMSRDEQKAADEAKAAKAAAEAEEEEEGVDNASET
ncbi:hypothetical protein KAR91_14185 [Candidatus Pacearchaeota archaeon]|nr:hypothetical protein [Candidatus Pacearchaeota archaeon]